MSKYDYKEMTLTELHFERAAINEAIAKYEEREKKLAHKIISDWGAEYYSTLDSAIDRMKEITDEGYTGQIQYTTVLLVKQEYEELVSCL